MLICVRLFAFTTPPEEGRPRQTEREMKRETNGRTDQKGQETNGVERKTRPVAERERDRLDGRGLDGLRKWDERSVREGQGGKVSI